MKDRKNTEKTPQRQSFKCLFFLTALSGMLCALLAVSVFVFFFVPRDKDMYILTVPKLVGLDGGNIASYPDIDIEREWIYSSDTEKGRVISQEPYAGAQRKLKNGEKYKVTVFISLGEQTEMIPDLSGVGEMNAAAVLRTMGACVKIMPIYGDGADGCVLYTLPSADTEIKRGDTVTVFVSRQRAEEPVTVPELCGIRLSEAYRRALSIGLFVSSEDGEALDSIVVAQSIASGARVKKGSYISFKTEKEEINERQWPPIPSENEIRSEEN